MNLLKSLLPIWFLPLAVAFSFQTGTTVIFEKTDTITVYSRGINNEIVIDSVHLKDSLNELILSPVKGEITQVGQYNSVDINTGDKTPNNKRQTSEENQQRHSKAQNSNDQQAVSSRHHIKVTQTGKNNSVKINSR